MGLIFSLPVIGVIMAGHFWNSKQKREGKSSLYLSIPLLSPSLFRGHFCSFDVNHSGMMKK
jgi:hypothetical protein